MWQTTSSPIYAHLVYADGSKFAVDVAPSGEVFLGRDSQGFPEDMLRLGDTLIVQFHEGQIIAHGERRVFVRTKGSHSDAYKWDCDGSLNRLFSHGRSRPAIWRAPSSKATIDNAREVVVSDKLSDTLATARKTRPAKG
jgi:hypothetical protein